MTGSATDNATHEALRLFRSIYAGVRHHLQNIERRCGASGAQVWALALVARQPGIRVTELAGAMAIHPSTASNLLAKAEKGGLLRRERSQADQRVVKLFLTELGADTLAKAPEPVAGLLPDALARLPQDVLLRLSADLQLLATRMDVQEDAAGRPFSEL
ncbi:MAG TPA: MarR family transcriptional regulator [Denitromonas sp.]|uniref:MarR family winged helix-turn-helix transcriptional regulator n=1 Tax=Denitromonas sp. TaxID=2734609 RepID=UPI001DDCBF5B|nr:MarR family transcriptional regulator [Rhodocyclaceae bacterium]MCP5221903.1 MarR family transcriptional regulator [Zoogloeaceae bacterium]HQV13575.1 MarR family transcriptional regulator [Denitromonas sp.]